MLEDKGMNNRSKRRTVAATTTTFVFSNPPCSYTLFCSIFSCPCKVNLPVREDKKRGVYVAGATEEYVTSADEVGTVSTYEKGVPHCVRIEGLPFGDVEQLLIICVSGLIY